MPEKPGDDAEPGGRQSDIDLILSKRHHKDGDFWATPDGRVYVGNPFSTLSCLLMLYELGLDQDHEVVKGGLELVLKSWREDGRIRLGPKAPMYPCYTAEAARVLCRYGYEDDERLRTTADYFLAGAHDEGGWRCNFTRFGSGPETECANPGATLFVLDALRFFENRGPEIDRAVESLLRHWEIRAPIGPCHYGIGKRFMQVEFPFLRYNLFFWVYVLSFYEKAVGDPRFEEALEALRGAVNEDGELVVENPHRGLKGLALCARGEPSQPATRRWREVEANLEHRA